MHVPNDHAARKMMDEREETADQFLIKDGDHVTTLRVQAEPSVDLIEALTTSSKELERVSATQFKMVIVVQTASAGASAVMAWAFKLYELD